MLNPPKPSAYSYIRMSSDVQLKGDSLRRQQEASRNYATANGLNLIEDFQLEDIGVSAFKGANVSGGAFGKFLERVKAGEVAKGSYLLVESLDRISRQEILQSLPVFIEILNSGINLVTLVDGQVYKAGESEMASVLYAVISLARAHDESKTKSVRVGAAWANKRKNAATEKLTKTSPAWLKLRDDRSTYDPIPDRVATIEQMFAWADDGHGSYAIARRLNEQRVETFGASNGWHESYVTKILNNRAVLGEFQPHRINEHGVRVPDGDAVAGYFPAIIEEGLFLRVQAARRKRAVEGAGRKGPEYRNLFTNLAKCAYCGAPMRFVHKGKPPKGYQYLKCTNAVRGIKCETSGWQYSDFETSFLYFVEEIDLSSTLKALAEKGERLGAEEQLLATREKLRQAEAKRERIFELVSDPSSTSDFIKSKLTECESEIATIRSRVAELNAQLDEIRPTSSIDDAELRELIARLKGNSDPETPNRRAAVAHRLRSMVTSLTLAVEGARPKRAGLSAMLEDTGISATEREALLSHIDWSNMEAQRYNRSFTVVMADGQARNVIVSQDDPTAIVANVLADADGIVSGVDQGREILSQ